MNKLLLIASAGMATLGITTSVIAASADGTATANVLTPITITNATDLEFGDIDVTSNGIAGGTVIVTAAGLLGGASTLTAIGTQSAGTFNLTGIVNATFSINITTVSELSDGTDNLILSAYTHDAGANPQMGGAGTLTLGVGATITADGGEGVGGYTGTYSVDVNYN